MVRDIGRCCSPAAPTSYRSGEACRPAFLGSDHPDARAFRSRLGPFTRGILNVQIYAHWLEMPYLTGKSDYPPPDPTVGGAIAFLSRFMPSGARNFTGRIRELQPNEVPGAAGWEWLATPGHSPGHISLFRPSDRVLVAAEALASMNRDSWTGRCTGRKRLLAPANLQHGLAAATLIVGEEELANLRPNVVGCGHGFHGATRSCRPGCSVGPGAFGRGEMGATCAARRALTNRESSHFRRRHSIRSLSRPPAL